MPKSPLPFPTIDAKPDERTLAERLGDTLAESYDEDKPAEYRLGLLQGALQIAVPQLIAERSGAVTVTAAVARRTRAQNEAIARRAAMIKPRSRAHA